MAEDLNIPEELKGTFKRLMIQVPNEHRDDRHVQEIIRLVNPAIVLLTGNVACFSVIEQTGITKLRGTWIQHNGLWIMPIFHPSYLLRNPSKQPGSPKSLMWDDIREVRKKYDQIGP